MDEQLDEFAFEECEGHSGRGWYFWSADYPDEGSWGPFHTREEAEAAAKH